MAKTPKKDLKSIRSGVISRGFSLAKLSLGASSRIAAHKLGNLISGEDPSGQRLQDLLLAQVKALASELGQLKGSLMKVGQMLSMYGEHFLPPEVNSILKSLQYQSPPLQWRSIKKELVAELGNEKLAELEIDHTPLASASLGQVHRAKIIATGEEIALKIQYPGVAKAIDSDIRTLRGIFGMAQLIPRMPHLDELFSEVKEMLVQEIDYRKELEYTDYFREAFKNDKRIVVPKTYPRFSTSRVLATSFEEGFAVDSPEVAALSQERRNNLGMIALEVYYQELFKLGRVQTDPHLGNYRIKVPSTFLNRGASDYDDKLILLDFGALRTFDEHWLKNYRAMVRASLHKDRIALQKAAEALRFSQSDDDEKLKEIFAEFCFVMTEPVTQGIDYDYKKTDLPKRLTRMVGTLISNFKLRAPPREVVFLDRKTGGVFIFLSVLGAKLNSRVLLDSYLTEKQ